MSYPRCHLLGLEHAAEGRMVLLRPVPGGVKVFYQSPPRRLRALLVHDRPVVRVAALVTWGRLVVDRDQALS